MDYRGCLFIGVIIFFLLLYWVRKFGKKPSVAKTANARNFILFVLDLVLVAGGMAIALWSIQITSGGKQLTPTQLSQLNMWVNEYFNLLWTLAGIALGAFILMVGQYISGEREDKNKVSKDKREKEIRDISNDIWIKAGRPSGYSVEHWLKAEAIWEESNKKREPIWKKIQQKLKTKN